MMEFNINYLAVGVAAIATIVVGALWYSPLMFGDMWLQAHDYSREDVRSTAGRAFIMSMCCYVVMALVLAFLARNLEVSSMLHGVRLGFLVWLGFLATLGLTSHVYSGNAWTVYFIDTGYQCVYAVMMGIILATWH